MLSAVYARPRSEEEEEYSRPAKRHDDQHDHDRRDSERRDDTAQFKATVRVGLGERVAEGRSEGARQDICGPEHHALRDIREEVCRRHEREQPAEDERAAIESETGGGSNEVTQRRAERV